MSKFILCLLLTVGLQTSTASAVNVLEPPPRIECSASHGEMVPFVKEEPKPIQLEEGVAIDKEQFRALIKDVLQELDLYSESAEELLMLTAATESHLGTYLTQVGGPAQGVFQCEPATEKDIWKNYLRYKAVLSGKIKGILGGPVLDAPFELRANLVYQIAIARVHYLRVKAPLPPHDDVTALATYYKQHYNTYKGKATVEKAVESYEVYVA